MSERITIHDICSATGLSARQVRRYVAAGIIPAPKKGLDATYDPRSITILRQFRLRMAEGTIRLNRQVRDR